MKYFIIDQNHKISIMLPNDHIFRTIEWTDEGVVTIKEEGETVYINDFNIKINDMAINPDDIESLYIAIDDGLIHGQFEKDNFVISKTIEMVDE